MIVFTACWENKESFIESCNVCMKHDTIYPTPPLGQDMTQGQFLGGV